MASYHLVASIILLMGVTYGQSDCQSILYDKLDSGEFFTVGIKNSGKYLNELGNKEMCLAGGPNWTFRLQKYE